MVRSFSSTAGRRLAVAAAGVAALTVSAVVAPQMASGTSVTFGFTAAVNGVAGDPLFTPDPAPVDLTLTNPSGSNRRVGLAVYVVPSGLTLGAVTNNRSWTTWTTSCSFLGSTVADCSKLVWVWRGSKARLNPGESLTTRVNVTPTGGAGTRTFRVQSLGFDLNSGLFSISNTAAIQVVDPVANTLTLSVDTNPVLVDQPTQVTVTATQVYGGKTYPRPFPAPITFTTASGQVPSLQPVDAGTDSDPEVVSLTFDTERVGEVLTATSGSLTSNEAVFDVVRSGAVYEEGFEGEIKISGPGGTFTALLGNGFVGDLAFTEVPCEAIDPELACDTEVNLNGTFKDESGNLYSNENPAGVAWTCPAEQCPFVAPEASYSEVVQNQWVDFDTYKVEVSLKKDDGTYTPFEEAGFCNAKVGDPSLGIKGKITVQEAQAPTAENPDGKGFCVDVYGIERAGDSFAGDLTIPVLFVEDPKIRGI